MKSWIQRPFLIFHTSNQPKSPNVQYVTYMDPLTCLTKFEVMQPLCVIATRAGIFDFLLYRPYKMKAL